MIQETNFQKWVERLSENYQNAQIKAAVQVNGELIKFYLLLGEEISKTSFKATYGSNFYKKLSLELKRMLPNAGGLSERNIRYCYVFYTMYKGILQQVVAKLIYIPWGHHIVILGSCKKLDEALFYIDHTIKNNLSRNQLIQAIDRSLFKTRQNAITNFDNSLPMHEKELALEMIKDPYILDFLQLREDYDEKELKEELEKNIKSFLLELGNGFSYVGSEYKLIAGHTELFCDMLFYNFKMHCFVVVEIKTNAFKPEYMGQLAGYVGTIDATMKSEIDNKTVGLLICKSKDDILAKYTLEKANFPLGISEYELANLIPEKIKHSLPTIEEIENYLNKK